MSVMPPGLLNVRRNVQSCAKRNRSIVQIDCPNQPYLNGPDVQAVVRAGGQELRVRTEVKRKKEATEIVMARIPSSAKKEANWNRPKQKKTKTKKNKNRSVLECERDHGVYVLLQTGHLLACRDKAA